MSINVNSADTAGFKSLQEILQFRASDLSSTGTKVAFTHLGEDGCPDESMTFRELDLSARSIAAHLRLYASPGDRALLAFSGGLDFVRAFFGCLYSGIIAVPVAPPSIRSINRMERIARDSGAQVIIAPSATVQRLTQIDCLSDRTWLAIESLKELDVKSPIHIARGFDTAYLQYTSGSTEYPKGVMISHNNILANVWHGARTFSIGVDDITVGWIPPYHDMGLIGAILQTVYSGNHSISLAPEAFLISPYRWLKAISDYRATFTGAPNFAYDLCIRKISIEQRQSLDLSSLRTAANGAERVRIDTIVRFFNDFSPFGFRIDAMKPAYGLAESTLHVTASIPVAGLMPKHMKISKSALEKNRIQSPVDSEDIIDLVSSGPSKNLYNTVEIIDTDSNTILKENLIGEILVSGPSVSKGYWGVESRSQSTFVSDEFQSSRLSTGDLGFLNEGDLYVVGRKKEIIILNGRNIHPQDIETSIWSISEKFVPNGCAAFGVEEENISGLVIVQETKASDGAELILEIRSALADQHEIFDVLAIIFVKPGRIPRTSSGKIQRVLCRSLYLTGKLSPTVVWPAPESTRSEIGYVAPHTPTQEILCSIWAEVLKLDRVGIHDNFFELGGHSLLAVRLIHLIKQDTGIQLSLVSLFQNPTLVQQAEAINAAGLDGPELEKFDSLPTIVPEPQSGHLPFELTDVQQAYWIGQKSIFPLGGIGTHFYNESRLSAFDPTRFNRALNQLIARHGMLRAIFNPDGTQQILPQVPEYRIREHDLRGLAPEAAAAELTQVRDELSHQVFNTNQWPLFECRVTLLDNDRPHLHFSGDMLITDAQSARILKHEFALLCRNPDAVLPILDLSFRDYVLAAQAMRDSQWYRRSLQYWRERLTNFASAPELPLAVNPETVRHPKFVRRSSMLSAPQWEQLKAYAKKINVTPSAFLLTAFSDVLATWSKQSRMTINLTLFNRLALHPQVNDLVGDFTSLTLLEVKVDSNTVFEDKAKAVQIQLWSDLDHAAVSGVQVMRELARLHGIQKIAMPVVFTSTLTNEKIGQQQAEQLNDDWNGAESVYSITQTSQVWLDHQVFESNGTLVFVWDAVEELFPSGMLDDMFEAYCVLLRRLITDERAWRQPCLDLLPPTYHAWQQEINATETPVNPALLHELFDKQVSLDPTRLAIICKERTLTYGELRQRARQLGAQLQASGAQPNTLVALVMEKGWEQVVAALGVLYAGAAYVPIDPGLPPERLQHILDHTETAIILTQSYLVEGNIWPAAVECIYVDQLSQDDQPTLQPLNTSFEDLAYVIYTSGSTGLPKGVEIDHRGAVNTVLDINERFSMNERDRVLALSSLSFDLSVFDIFGTLAAGAAIVIPPPQAMRDPQQWLELMLKEQVTVWNSVPALLTMLMEHINERTSLAPKSLRVAMLSGDWIPLALPERLRALVPAVQLISLGGATEASIWSIYFPINQVQPEWNSIPYGTPLRNQSFYVLNEALEPRPVWVPGQLYIGGLGLARGYWRDVQRTNASFITHPITGKRLYKTGDLGRYLPDGNIEFLGREDSQVKIQGYRVELGEIEAALESHPDVKACAVNTVGHVRGEKYLAAYVVIQSGHTIKSEALSAYLQAKLPKYMVPNAFITLDSLPLTPNGKIDRKALRQVQVKSPTPRDIYELNGTDAQHIVRIVQSILKISPIGLDVNLLTLGATSIDVVRISNALFAELMFRPQLDQFMADPRISTVVEMYLDNKAQSSIAASVQSPVSARLDGQLIMDPLRRGEFKDRRLGRRIFEGSLPKMLASSRRYETWSQLLSKYRSVRKFSPATIDQEVFSDFLRNLAEGSFRGKPKYLYPSAGGLYPVQTYLYIKHTRIHGIAAGCYYYDPKYHTLVATAPANEVPIGTYDYFVNRPVFEEAAFAIYFIAQMEAIEPMYGSKARDFCNIEAGAMAQLLTMAAVELNLGLCGIGEIDVDEIATLFDLKDDHRLIYSMLGGFRMEEIESEFLHLNSDEAFAVKPPIVETGEI